MSTSRWLSYIAIISLLVTLSVIANDRGNQSIYTYQLDGFLPVEYEWTPNIMIEELLPSY